MKTGSRYSLRSFSIKNTYSKKFTNRYDQGNHYYLKLVFNLQGLKSVSSPYDSLKDFESGIKHGDLILGLSEEASYEDAIFISNRLKETLNPDDETLINFCKKKGITTRWYEWDKDYYGGEFIPQGEYGESIDFC